MRGRRCVVCGQQHASCGGPSVSVAVDEGEAMPRPREPLAEYDVVVNGHHTTMRLRPSTVAKLYPGAVPRHRARLAPEPVTPAPPGPPVAGVLENLGGGWWRLPDGSRVRGREAAEEALAGS